MRQLGSAFIALLSMASPGVAQDLGLQQVKYCGLGVQGALTNFATSNPNVAEIYNDANLRQSINGQLLAASPAENWNINLSAEGGGASGLAMSHVITFENVDPQPFIDPRTGKKLYNVSYSVGINTVLFDLNARQIRAMVPAIARFSDLKDAPPSASEQRAAFDGILQSAGTPDGPLARWLSSIKSLPLRYDEQTYFQVLPVNFEDEVREKLIGEPGGTESDGAKEFSERATTQSEALIAMAFAKPIVPATLIADPISSDPAMAGQASSNQYVATIPDCLGDTGADLIMPDPTYQLRLTIHKLASAQHNHEFDSYLDSGQKSVQQEVGFGGRFGAEIIAFNSIGDSTILDSRTFSFAKSVRFTGERDLNSYEEYLKLTTTFVRELLDAYTSQDKDWIKAHMSAAVTDKKARKASGVQKAWRELFQKKLRIPKR
jgi:hypothetical protein